MTRANLLKLLAMSFILTVTAVGCKKAPTYITPITGTTRSGPGPSKPTGPTDGPVTTPGSGLPGPGGTDTTTSKLTTTPQGTELGAREDDGNFWVDRDTFKQNTVYFEYDKSELMPSEKAKVDAVAEFLKSNPTFKLKLEGHCDERGTDEYNRSLGERRALSIREYLITVSIAAERVGTISYGEDKPAVLGQDEFAYAKNRRGEFIVLKPKTP